MLLPGTCEEGYTLMGKIFRILGALAIAVGILGAPYFQNIGSSKIWKNGSAPFNIGYLLLLDKQFSQNFEGCQHVINISFSALK